jgi:ATP adenylyltransferase
VVQNLAKKPTGALTKDVKVDPFENPESHEHYVTTLSESHVLLLNRFPVLANHSLIVTKQFEKQTDPLNLRDFTAILHCLLEIDGFVFFNCGPDSGASQPHKHIQVLPQPLVPNRTLPLYALIQRHSATVNELARLAEYEFSHCFVKLDSTKLSSSESAKYLLEKYLELMKSLEIELNESKEEERISYNLLMTKEWFFMVKRGAETAEGLSVNSVGFTGCILVKSQEQFQILKQLGPLTLLKRVARP